VPGDRVVEADLCLGQAQAALLGPEIFFNRPLLMPLKRKPSLVGCPVLSR
jgi:hypothetical protein